MTETDLQTTFWRDDVWLSQTVLTTETALRDYFSLSTFYDPQCNNETIKTLNLSFTELHTLAPGVEYVLVSASEPDLFVIKKQYRSENQDTTPLAYYYILSGTVYQAPDLHSAIRSKVKRCQFLLEKSFRSFSEAFDPRTTPSKESDEAKRKFESQQEWEKMKTGTDIVNAVLANYPIVPASEMHTVPPLTLSESQSTVMENMAKRQGRHGSP